MDVHSYYGPGNIVIDSCSGCDLIWLDQGELKTIVDAPGRDRGGSAGSPGTPRTMPDEPQMAPLSPLLSLSDLWELLE